MSTMENPLIESQSAEDLAARAGTDPNLIEALCAGILSKSAKTRFTSAKALRELSKKKPEALYPRFDFFVSLLDSANNIIKWNAIDVLGNLAPVDKENKINKTFKKLHDLFYEGALTTAAHVVDNAGRIIESKPVMEPLLTDMLLNQDDVPLPTEECASILAGKTITAFGSYFDKIEHKGRVIAFVERQKRSERPATRAKAIRFLESVPK